MAPVSGIPTIDLAPYLHTDSTQKARNEVVEAVKSACMNFGFLQITGHGVPLVAQQEMLECCRTFFDLPVEQKEALSLENSPSRHGYERMREQVLNTRALPDDKEVRDHSPVPRMLVEVNRLCKGFYIGKEEPYEKGFRQGPNQWPDLPAEIFRAPVTRYYEHLLKLGQNLMGILALGLGHPVEVLESFNRNPVQNLKLLHYPPHTSEDARQFGAGEHTDFGAITMLLQQPGKDGLQVHDATTDEWLDIPAREDILIVNMGDLIQKWTNGAFRSTVHRVINAAGDDRYSVPCFYEGNFEATNPFNPGKSDGETVEQHVRRKFDSSYGLK